MFKFAIEVSNEDASRFISWILNDHSFDNCDIRLGRDGKDERNDGNTVKIIMNLTDKQQIDRAYDFYNKL